MPKKLEKFNLVSHILQFCHTLSIKKKQLAIMLNFCKQDYGTW